jgi:hypothetical protein
LQKLFRLAKKRKPLQNEPRVTGSALALKKNQRQPFHTTDRVQANKILNVHAEKKQSMSFLVTPLICFPLCMGSLISACELYIN